MREFNPKKLISDNVLVHYLIWLIYLCIALLLSLAVIIKFPYFINNFSLVLFSIVVVLDLLILFSVYFFFSLLIETKKVELDYATKTVIISSYYNHINISNVPILSVLNVEKKFPHLYSFKYKIAEEIKQIHFHSLDLDLKFFFGFIPMKNFHNSDVLCFTELVVEAKNETL